MHTTPLPSAFRQMALPGAFIHPAPQETFSDARYEVRFVQNAEELDAVLKLRFTVFNLELGEGKDLSVKIPRLFQIYLEHGAKVCGPPAIDRRFKTIDYLVVLDIATLDQRTFRMFFP